MIGEEMVEHNGDCRLTMKLQTWTCLNKEQICAIFEAAVYLSQRIPWDFLHYLAWLSESTQAKALWQISLSFTRSVQRAPLLSCRRWERHRQARKREFGCLLKEAILPSYCMRDRSLGWYLYTTIGGAVIAASVWYEVMSVSFEEALYSACLLQPAWWPQGGKEMCLCWPQGLSWVGSSAEKALKYSMV